MTPKTVIELLRCTHGERGRLLVMKRTEPREIPRARLLELDVVADDPNDVGLLLERVFEVGRGHGAKLYCGMEWKRGFGRPGVEGCGKRKKAGRLPSTCENGSVPTEIAVVIRSEDRH